MNLNEREKETLLHLINTELDGICGDLGYMELKALREKIDNIQVTEQEQ
ncbi:hypothetical protein [Moritella marina]|nr:hypothetical protein [Moritella marina]